MHEERILKNKIKSFVFPMEFFAVFILFFLTFPYFASAGQVTLPPNNLGLVGYWSFEDATGTVATDFSGNGNAGTLTNGPTWTTGKIGKAVSFDGSNDFVEIANASSLNNSNGTISTWVYVTETVLVNAGQIVSISNGASTQNYIQFYYYNNKVYFSLADNSTTLFGFNTPISYSQWFNVTVVGGSSGNAVYINGVAVSPTYYVGDNTVTAWLDDLTSITNARIGATRYNNTDDNFFKGYIDDVRIYSRALSATEISNLYNRSSKNRTIQSSQKNLVPNGLVGYWSFDGSDISGTSAYDRSGNNNTGTLTNGPTVAIGKVGQALVLSGNVAVVDFSFKNSHNIPIAYSFWVKNTLAETKYLFADISQTEGIQSYIDASGKFNFQICSSGSCYTLTSNTAVNNGNWRHVVVAWDGTTNVNTVQIYVDGILDAQGTSTKTTTTPDCGFVIGGYRPSNACGAVETLNTYVGSIDEFRIYNRALTTSEINQLYKAGEAKLQATQNSKLTNGLVGLWSFDGPDISGTTAYDRSGNGNNGTLTNGPTVAIGKVGQALQFDGTNDIVAISDSASLEPGASDWTISLWSYVNDISRYNQVMGKWTATGEDQRTYAFVYDTGSNGKMYLVTSNNGTSAKVTYSDGGAIVQQTWQHVVVVKSGTEVTFYVNGVAVGDDGTAVDSTMYSSTSGTYLGNYEVTSNAYNFGGKLDDVRIYNRALSTSEIQMLYNMGR